MAKRSMVERSVLWRIVLGPRPDALPHAVVQGQISDLDRGGAAAQSQDHVAEAGEEPGEAGVAAETGGIVEVLARVEGVVGVALKTEA